MFRGPDRLFRRYQQTGEPRLLGAVFDRTAGELLRVATHLTRDRHRAEDLLQTTFLTAIEKARQYDPARPLLPWLLAILANHAREWHRRERRTLPVPTAPSAGGDVGDTAALRDVGDIVLPDTASLAIRLRAADGAPVREVRLRLAYAREVNSGTDYLEPDEVDGTFRKAGINPGGYVLRLAAPGIAPQNVDLTLTAGERRELDLVAERAVTVVLEFRCRLDAPQDSGNLNGQLTITDAGGVRVVQHRLWPYFDDLPQRLARLRLGLLPGTYRVHAEEFGGKKKEIEIVVPAVAPAEPFVIDLR